MKNCIKILPLLFLLALTFSGCTTKATVDMQPIVVPEDGKPYAFTYKSSMNGKGGGISTITGIAGGKCVVRDGKGNPIVINGEVKFGPCEIQVTNSGTGPDRVDSLGNAVLGAGAQVWSADIKARAIKKAAKINAEASGNSGSNVFVSTQTQTNVESAFDVSNCPPGGSCFDPTQ